MSHISSTRCHKLYSVDTEPQTSTYPVNGNPRVDHSLSNQAIPPFASSRLYTAIRPGPAKREKDKPGESNDVCDDPQSWLSLAAKSPDSHSQAITHTPCFPHKLCEGLLGNEDALIWGCGEHYITQPCVHHGHVSPLPLWLLSLGDVAPSRSHAAFSRLIFDFIEGPPKPFFFTAYPLY